MVTRLWWLSCLSNGFQPLRIRALYQRSDRTTKEFVNTLRKISYLPQYFSRQISAVTFLDLGIWQWRTWPKSPIKKMFRFTCNFVIFGYVRVEWSCWTQTYMYQCSQYCNITNSTVLTYTLRMYSSILKIITYFVSQHFNFCYAIPLLFIFSILTNIVFSTRC